MAVRTTPVGDTLVSSNGQPLANVAVSAQLLVPGGATPLDSNGDLIELTAIATTTNSSGVYLFDPNANNGLIATGDIYQWQSGALVALPGCLWQISFLATTITGSFAYSASEIHPSTWLPTAQTLGLFKMYLVDVAGNALAQAGVSFAVSLGADAVWSGGRGTGQNVSAAASFSATTDSTGTVSYWLIRQSELNPSSGYYQAVEQQPGSRILQFTCPTVYTNDAGVWASGTTYALNAVVREPATDIPYSSLIAGNVGHDPASSPTDWALYAGEKITAYPTAGVTPGTVAFGEANILADNAVASGTYALPPVTLQDQLRQLTQIQARHVTATTYTVVADDDVIDADGTANVVAITLPTAVGWSKLIAVKAINVTNAVTITTTSAQTIDGAAPPLTPALNTCYVFLSDGANWRLYAAYSVDTDTGGTVTSVALTVPSWLAVAGSPITTSGTLAVTENTQSANTGLLGPTTGAAAAPTFRALVTADLPPLTVQSKTAAYTILVTDDLILVNASGGAVTITLPAASTISKRYTVVKTDSGANAVTLSRAGSDTINGATTQVISSQYGKLTVANDGVSAWYLIA